MYSYGEKKFANVKGYFTDYYHSRGGCNDCKPINLRGIVGTTCKLEGGAIKYWTVVSNIGTNFFVKATTGGRQI